MGLGASGNKNNNIREIEVHTIQSRSIRFNTPVQRAFYVGTLAQCAIENGPRRLGRESVSTK